MVLRVDLNTRKKIRSYTWFFKYARKTTKGASCFKKRSCFMQLGSDGTYQWLLKRDMWMSASLSKAPQMPVFRETSTHLALDSKIKIFATGLPRMVLRGCQSVKLCHNFNGL